MQKCLLRVVCLDPSPTSLPQLKPDRESLKPPARIHAGFWTRRQQDPLLVLSFEKGEPKVGPNPSRPRKWESQGSHSYQQQQQTDACPLFPPASESCNGGLEGLGHLRQPVKGSSPTADESVLADGLVLEDCRTSLLKESRSLPPNFQRFGGRDHGGYDPNRGRRQLPAAIPD